MNGDESRFTATLVTDARWRGEGVKGMRPPAVRVEKSPAWDLIGVDTDAVAMVVSDINDISDDATGQCLDGRSVPIYRMSSKRLKLMVPGWFIG